MLYRKFLLFLVVCACTTTVFSQSTSLTRPKRESELLRNRQALPDFDSRRNVRIELPAGRSQAIRDFRKNLGPDVQVSLNSETGGVRHAFRKDGYLTQGGTGDARSILNQFIDENAAAFGLAAGEIGTYVDLQQKDSVGVTHVYLYQELGGIRVFGTLIKGHIDSAGRLISVEAMYYPRSSAPSRPATLSAKDAVIAAMRSSLPDLLQKTAANQVAARPLPTDTIMLAGGSKESKFPGIISRSNTADQATVFDRGPLKDDIRTKLVIFPSAGRSSYGWQVYLHAADRQASYVVVIDARSGRLLYRTNTYRYAPNSNASVFPKDPVSTPLTVLPYFGSTALSPNGWSDGPATIGNNVQADSATSATDFIYPFTNAWEVSGLNNFDLSGLRIRYTPVDVLATGYTVSVFAAGSTAPAATNLLPFYTNTDDGTIQLICGAGWTANVLGGTFSSFFVNTNGSISLGAGITDSFPSKVSFANDARRAAGLWRDLNPGGGGTLTGDCAAEGGGTRIRMVWNGVPNFPSGGSHTFSMIIHGIGTGLDNIIDVDYGAVTSPTGELVGVGGNTGTPFDPTTTGIVNYANLSAGLASPPATAGVAQTFPDPDLNLSITNFGFHLNTMHDFFYNLGFTESAGNYQTDNFNKGGAAFDPVQAEAQFGMGVFNNAFFQPAPDGILGFTAFGLFDVGGGCRRDSGFDSGVIYHEYTHGVSTRMVGGPQNVNTLSSFQGGALGEGWSDAYPNSIQNDPVIGAYVVCDPAGIRSAPYNAHPGKYSDFGNKDGPFAAGIGLVFTPEVHLDGEIWAATMWDIGQSIGATDLQTLIFDGFRYTPVEPSMVDARNGILIADLVRFNGLHQTALFNAFAARGLGASASTSPGSFDVQPLASGWETTVFAAFDTAASPYTSDEQVVFIDDFEGVNTWTVAGATNLWHISSRRASSGTNAFYYGQEGTGNYNTGARNFGSLMSPAINVPALLGNQAIKLEWDQFRSTEAFFFDGGWVRIIDVVAGTTTQVSFVQNTLTSFGNVDFAHQTVNLNQFAGKQIQIEFFIDTFDSIANSTEGWYIDNVKLSVIGSGCSFADNFEAATVDPTKWTIIKPSFTQSGGNFVGIPTGKKAFVVATGFAGCGSNCTIDTFMEVTGGAAVKATLLAWHIDKGTTIELQMKQDSNAWILLEKLGGSKTVKTKISLTINPNQSYHVVLTYDGATVKLFIDGIEVGSILPVRALTGTIAYTVKNTQLKVADVCVR